MTELLQHTPRWVFGLFLGLLVLGCLHRRDREMGRIRVSVLPAAMLALSAYGVFSAFGNAAIGLAAWIVGVASAVGFGGKYGAPKARYSRQTRTFFIPGGWLPLLLMMVIFFTKYAVAVVVARHLPIAGHSGFIGSIGFCYGVFGGFFLARAIAIWRCQIPRPSSA